MPSAGGMPTNIASGPDTINRIAVGRDGVYWTTTAGTVMKIDRTGTATVLATGQGSTSELVVDTDSVCWVRVETRAIMKVGVSGGQPVELTITPNGPAMSLAVDAAHVYWADQDNTVMWASLADGIPKRLFPTAGVTGLAVDASGVYWTDRAGFVVVGHPTSPAPPQAIAGGGRSTVFGVVLDATSVYWIGDGLGSIYRKPK
jgi:sugar lactone lactonase YvrE